jgi:hypothetical protein
VAPSGARVGHLVVCAAGDGPLQPAPGEPQCDNATSQAVDNNATSQAADNIATSQAACCRTCRIWHVARNRLCGAPQTTCNAQHDQRCRSARESTAPHRTASHHYTMSLARRFESAVQRRCGLTLRPCRTVRYALLGQLVRCAATVANVRVVRGQLALTQLETARELGTHVLTSMLPLCTRAQHRRARTHDTHHARSHHLLGR